VRGWPRELILVRHGESIGNIANARAYAAGAQTLDLDLPDPQVPLSDLGVRQAVALGERLGAAGPPPEVCVVSPYLRTTQTADHLLAAAGWEAVRRVGDERLRDREQGIADRLTIHGLRARLPEEAARRAFLGKFFYRPPGGESWADVALRIRALVADLRADHAGERVLLVTHDVPILITRYVIESLTPAEALTLSGQVVNCGLTAYAGLGDHMLLERFNDATPVVTDDDAAVTTHGERP
jgi:broad specificity phosphatase PhoE